MLPAAPRNRQDSLLQGLAQPGELGRGRGLPMGLNTNPQPDSIPGASTLSRSGRGHPGEEPWLCQAPGLPHPGRDLFFIIFGTTGRAAICQAPCPYKYASGSVYGDGWGGGLRWG